MKTKVYPVGTIPYKTKPGDIILVHRKSLYSNLIGLGQWLTTRKWDRRFIWARHVACVAGEEGELVEALGKGVEERHISVYKDIDFIYVDIEADNHDREQMHNFLYACVGRPYNWFEIISLGITIISGAKLVFGNPGTLICSALAAQMLCRGDFIFERDPSVMMPWNIAKKIGASKCVHK